MFYDISKKAKRKTLQQFNYLIKNSKINEYLIDDLKRMIDNNEATFYDIADFKEIKKDGKSFYTCNSLDKKHLFELQDNTLIWQRSGMCEGNYYGYIAYKRNDNKWSIFEFDQYVWKNNHEI